MDIAIYIAKDNPIRALTFVDELEARCNALGAAPGIGTARPELGDDVRMLPYGRYLVFHRTTKDVLRIERIVHGARDIGRIDFAPDEAEALVNPVPR